MRTKGEIPYSYHLILCQASALAQLSEHLLE